MGSVRVGRYSSCLTTWGWWEPPMSGDYRGRDAGRWVAHGRSRQISIQQRKEIQYTIRLREGRTRKA